MDIKLLLNVATVTFILTVSFYHIILYIGRIKIKIEKYNLFLALFTLACATYITFTYFIYYFGITVVIVHQVTVGLIFILTTFSIYFISYLFNIAHKKRKVFIPPLIMIGIAWMITLSAPVKGLLWYRNNFMKYVIFIIVFAHIVIICQCIYIFIKRKLYRSVNNYFFLFGLILLLEGGGIERAVPVMENNFVIMGLSVFLFAIALVNKFNREYKHLLGLRKNLEIKVQEATTKLEEQKDANKRIFVNFAHETKTPLSIIKGYLEMLIKDAKRKDLIPKIYEQVEKLIIDVVNFLDAARVENDQQLYIHDTIINFSCFVRDQITLRKEAADCENVTMIGHIKSKLIIKSNVDAITRLLDNLIGNALKYTEKGSVTIDLQPEGKQIKLIIRDTGMGIKDENLPHIFEPSFRGELAIKACKEGQGNGLVIVKNIIDSLNGTIKVESIEGNGTIFTVLIPEYSPRPEEEVISSSLEKPKSQGKNKADTIDIEDRDCPRVLIVDDNSDMRKYFEDQLKNKYKITTAINGRDALEKLSKMPRPDVIISDRMMPVMDGDQFFQETREEYSKVPFIFLTAKNEKNDKTTALNAGVVEYFSKPFDLLLMVGKMDSLIALNKLDTEIENRNLDDIETDEIREAVMHYAEEYNLQGQMIEIVILLIAGKKVKVIAEELQTSDNSISQQKKRILERLPIDKPKYKIIDRYDLARIFKII